MRLLGQLGKIRISSDFYHFGEAKRAGDIRQYIFLSISRLLNTGSWRFGKALMTGVVVTELPPDVPKGTHCGGGFVFARRKREKLA